MPRTLLVAVNDVLLQIGERPSSSLTSVVGRKAFLALEAALMDVNSASDWTFKRFAVPATQRNQETYTIPGLERIDKVHYRDLETGNERPLKYLPAEDLRELFRLTEGRPEAYALTDDETITVLPYPPIAEIGNIVVYGTKSIVMPSGADEVIDLPERFYPMLLGRALYHMLLTHLSDQAAANAKNNEFLQLVARFVQKESAHQRRGRNMFRQRGHNGRTVF